MKIIRTIFVTCFFVLCSFNSAVAQKHELPEPQDAASRTSAASTTAAPPNPPGVPIDNNIMLTMGSLVLGTVVIYRNKKASL